MACVEDHDDLMPVFAARGKELSDTYGDFFLADMIELQDEKNKASNARQIGDEYPWGLLIILLKLGCCP